MPISTYVNDLFVEGGLVVLVNRSMPALWLLALPIDCVLGEVEGVCMPISFRRWFCTNTGKTFGHCGAGQHRAATFSWALRNQTDYSNLCRSVLRLYSPFSSLLHFELWEALPVWGTFTQKDEQIIRCATNNHCPSCFYFQTSGE